MEILSLNVWGGKCNSLGDYLSSFNNRIGVFMFQEADKNFPKLADNIFGENYRLYQAFKKVDDNDIFSMQTWVKNDLAVVYCGTVMSGRPNVGLGLEVQIRNNSNKEIVSLCNVHGVSRPGDKKDTPNRITQSEVIINHFHTRSGAVIIGGDLNLDSGTKSVEDFSRGGYINLISKHGITNTRNENIWKKYPDNKQYYSDWIFVRGTKVLDFCVPQDNLTSDHLPMILEIE